MAKHPSPFSIDDSRDKEWDPIDVLMTSMAIGIKDNNGNPTCFIDYQLQWGEEHVVSIEVGYFMEHIAHVKNEKARVLLNKVLDGLEGHITRAWEHHNALPPDPPLKDDPVRFRVTMEVEVLVSNFRGETSELPSRQEVIDAMNDHLSSGLFCPKEFAEDGIFQAYVDTKIIYLKE